MKFVIAERWELFHALRTRVLTEDEFRLVLRLGHQINIPTGVAYSREECSLERIEAFSIQLILRQMAAEPAGIDRIKVPTDKQCDIS